MAKITNKQIKTEFTDHGIPYNKPFYSAMYDALQKKFPDLDPPEQRKKYAPDAKR